MKRFVLSRRAVLRGLGACVALPTLEVMLNSHGTAYAQGQEIPKRFGIFFWGNGVILNRWRPAATGASWQLTEELQPLAKVKSYVNVVSGMNVKIPDRRGHHTGSAAILSGHPFIELSLSGAAYSSKFGGPSIDQVAADIIGKTTRFASVQLAVSKRVTRGEGPTLQYISHRGPDAPLPPEFNPANLYTRLFGNFDAQPTSDPRDALRVSVLDAVRDDAKRLEARLGAADKARLDQHLTSISEVRKQIQALPPTVTSSCSKPATVTQTNSDVNGIEQLRAVSRAFSDLMAMAWACDLTRVMSLQFSGSVAGTVCSEIGHTESVHTLTHESARQEEVHQSVVFTMQNLAYLLEKLQATPDGTGNLLDNSLILATTDLSEGLSHSPNDYPILLAGRASGALKYPGIHFRGAGGNVSDVLMSCLKAAGTGVTEVGSAEGRSTTPLAAIMA